MRFLLINKKSVLINLALLFFTIFICFIFSEILLRSIWEEPVDTFYGYPTGLHIPDETRGYKYQPHFHGVFPGTLYKHIEIRINSKGLRDAEHEYSKKGKYRILSLGDSITFGTGVEVDDAYLAVLERLIQKKIDEKSDVVKAGVNGYEFDQEYAYYFEEGYKYEPDIVLIGVCLNDAMVADSKVLQEKKQSVARNISANEMKNLENENIYGKSFLDYFSTYKFSKMALHRLIHYREIKAKRDKYNAKYFYLIYNLWNGEPLHHYAKNLRNLNSFARLKKSRVVLVLFPYTQQFTHAENMGRLPQEKITALAEVNGIDVIDPYEILNREDYQNFYLKNDNTHLNEKGHRLVGEFIYREMIKKGFLQ